MSISGLEERRNASLPASSPFVEMRNADVDASRLVDDSAGTCILLRISRIFHTYDQVLSPSATCVSLSVDRHNTWHPSNETRDSIACDCAMISSATCDFSHRVQTMMCVSEVSSDLSRVTVDHKMAVASVHCFPLALKGGHMI